MEEVEPDLLKERSNFNKFQGEKKALKRRDGMGASLGV